MILQFYQVLLTTFIISVRSQKTLSLNEIITEQSEDCEQCIFGDIVNTDLAGEALRFGGPITEVTSPEEFKKKLLDWSKSRCLIVFANSSEDEGFNDLIHIFQRVTMPLKTLVLFNKNVNITNQIPNDAHTSFNLFMKNDGKIKIYLTTISMITSS